MASMEEVIYLEPFVEREKAPVLEMSDIEWVRKEVEEEEKLGGGRCSWCIERI